MYKEEKEDGKCAAKWSLECSNIDDWNALATRFQDSDNKDEQEFFTFLTEDLIPPLAAKAEAETRRLRRLGRSHINSNNIIESRPRRAASRRLYNYDEHQGQFYY